MVRFSYCLKLRVPGFADADRGGRRRMKIVVVAATGGIGRQILDQAVAAGHDVTAVVRSPAKLAGLPVRVVAADLAAADAAALESAIGGADAVLSGLGARTKSEAGVAWRGTQ